MSEAAERDAPVAGAGFCADMSAAAGEPLAGTAPRTDAWLLLEARGLWEPDALESPGVPDEARAAATAFLAAVPNGRVLLVRQPARRDLPGNHVFVVDARAGRERAVAWQIDGLAGLGEIDLADALDAPAGAAAGASSAAPLPAGARLVDHPLLLVCTHGKRDACCARLGLKLAAALEAEVPAEWLWQCSHIGGHRFAGNIVWLPQGIYLGRVAPEDAAAVAAAIRARRIPLAHARGRASLPPAAQAADLALRGRLGLSGVDDVVLVAPPEALPEAAGGAGAPAGFAVRLAAAGGEHLLQVRPQPAPAVVVSCGLEPEPQTRLVVA